MTIVLKNGLVNCSNREASAREDFDMMQHANCGVQHNALAELQNTVAALDWRFAKTMPQWPHWYIVRDPNIENVYVKLFQATIDHGKWEYFFKKQRQYLYLGDGFKYWRMTDDLNKSRIINRCHEVDSYS